MKRALSLIILFLVVITTSAPAQQASPVSPSLFAEMRWRNIGPHRGGRTRSAAGHPSAARSRSTPASATAACGRRPTPDGRGSRSSMTSRRNSIGSVVVAPSNPEHHLCRQRRGTAAAGPLGRRRHVTSRPTPARPGRTSACATAADSRTSRSIRGMPDRHVRRRARPSVRPQSRTRRLSVDRRRPHVPGRAAEGREHRRATTSTSIRPIRTSSTRRCGKGDRDRGRTRRGAARATALFKSTDGGSTWRALKNGLPAATGHNQSGDCAVNPETHLRARWRIGAARRRSTAPTMPAKPGPSSPTTRGRRAASAAAICPCRSSNPKNPDMLVMASTVSWKSVDGGKTWAPFKGAPGGEDYQGGWINPNNPDIVLLVADQGAVVTLNGGEIVELLVQPADRAAVSRDRGQRVSVSRVQRPAGKRIGVRGEPRQLRRDFDSRLICPSVSMSTATSRPIR